MHIFLIHLPNKRDLNRFKCFLLHFLKTVLSGELNADSYLNIKVFTEMLKKDVIAMQKKNTTQKSLTRLGQGVEHVSSVAPPFCTSSINFCTPVIDFICSSVLFLGCNAALSTASLSWGDVEELGEKKELLNFCSVTEGRGRLPPGTQLQSLYSCIWWLDQMFDWKCLSEYIPKNGTVRSYFLKICLLIKKSFIEYNSLPIRIHESMHHHHSS